MAPSGWNDELDQPRPRRNYIPPELIDEMIQGVDLVALIGEQVALKKTGRDQWMGLCPFHTEKTPSFKVDGDKGLYYCFGCHRGGNAMTFLKEAFNLSGRELIERLKQLSGMADLSGLDWTALKSQTRARGAGEIADQYQDGSRDSHSLESMTRIVSMAGGNLIKHNPHYFNAISAVYEEFLRAVWDEDEEDARRLFEEFNDKVREIQHGSYGDAAGDEGEDRGVSGVQPA